MKIINWAKVTKEEDIWGGRQNGKEVSEELEVQEWKYIWSFYIWHFTLTYIWTLEGAFLEESEELKDREKGVEIIKKDYIQVQNLQITKKKK